MIKHVSHHLFALYFIFLIPLLFPFYLLAQSREITIDVHPRRVYDCKISLLALSANQTFKPINEITWKGKENSVRLAVSKEYLPGEFVLRFDYREKESSTPYPSEKYIFISDQDIELWVNPLNCNNPDSAWFQKGERENSAFQQFSKENSRQKQKLAVLQNFLMNYDDIQSDFYQNGIKVYDKRRESYNKWLAQRRTMDKSLFVSNLYGFQYVPEISFNGNETDRINNLIRHYFDGMDFSSPLLIRTSDINKWMDGYVNLYGQLSTSIALRDSLFMLAGRSAIEKARQGDPLVYGWMVDYFYRGYESNGISAGMKILEPYLNDPKCLTSKRMEITRRLKGMETLIKGSAAPNIITKDLDGKSFELDKFDTESKYILVLFWSAGCSHCVETVKALYPWSIDKNVMQKISVLAISLDETETEIQSYKAKVKELKGWKHLHMPDGVRSKVAADYFVLSTPVMALIDAKTKKIVSIPDTADELIKNF